MNQDPRHQDFEKVSAKAVTSAAGIAVYLLSASPVPPGWEDHAARTAARDLLSP